MTRWLLDTDHVSPQERGHQLLKERLAVTPPNSIAISVITMEEMLRGRLAILARHQSGERRVNAYLRLTETVRFFSLVPVMPFDLAAESKFTALRAQHLKVGSQDMRISAIAQTRDLIVVTRNRKTLGEFLAFESKTGQFSHDTSPGL